MWAKVKQQFSDSAWVCLCAGVGLFFAQPALAYESAVHQQLTFLAAKQLSRCDQTSDLKPLVWFSPRLGWPADYRPSRQ